MSNDVTMDIKRTASMIVTIGNIKGGVGKSTLAANMAIVLAMARAEQGRDVLLVDGDGQSSATAFTNMRADTLDGYIGYTCVSLKGSAIRSQMAALRGKYADILVDCGGTDNPSLRAAMTVSDRLIIPVAPRSVDAWALEGMIELVREVRETINPALQSFILVNLADPQGHDNDAVKEIIAADYLTPPDDLTEAAGWSDTGVSILQPVIVRRKPFSDAFGRGLSIIEHRPRDPKAIEEFLAVMSVIYHRDAQGMYDDYSTKAQKQYA